MTNPLASRLLSASQVTKMKPPRPLIDGILTENSFAILYGKYASGKSFLALDWALSIANGCPWQGREVQQGAVLYILAEGASGMRDRVLAWYGDQEPNDGVLFLPEPLNLLNESAVEYGQAMARDMQAKLIVIDTLNQSIVGGDENSSTSMGQAVRSAKILQESGATVLIIHHTGHNGELRGHSSLPAAADSIIRAWTPDEENSNLIILYSKKVKEGQRFRPIRLRLEHVSVPGSVDGSCVITSDER